MEDMLEVDTRPHDPARPFVCLDKTSKQLVAETRSYPFNLDDQPVTITNASATAPAACSALHSRLEA